jgi:hypothetical protein
MYVCLLQVRQFIDGAYQRTLTLLREKKDFVEAMAQVRLWHWNDQHHTIHSSHSINAIGPAPHWGEKGEHSSSS